jgi:hypothetical protein
MSAVEFSSSNLTTAFVAGNEINFVASCIRDHKFVFLHFNIYFEDPFLEVRTEILSFGANELYVARSTLCAYETQYPFAAVTK